MANFVGGKTCTRVGDIISNWYSSNLYFDNQFDISSVYFMLRTLKIDYSKLWSRLNWLTFMKKMALKQLFVVYTIECDEMHNCKMNRYILKGTSDCKSLH